MALGQGSRAEGVPSAGQQWGEAETSFGMLVRCRDGDVQRAGCSPALGQRAYRCKSVMSSVTLQVFKTDGLALLLLLYPRSC